MPENLAGAVLLAELIEEWTTAFDLPRAGSSGFSVSGE